MITDLNVKTQSFKISRKKIKENLSDFGLDKGSLEGTPKSMFIEIEQEINWTT